MNTSESRGIPGAQRNPGEAKTPRDLGLSTTAAKPDIADDLRLRAEQPMQFSPQLGQALAAAEAMANRERRKSQAGDVPDVRCRCGRFLAWTCGLALGVSLAGWIGQRALARAEQFFAVHTEAIVAALAE